MTTVRLEAEAGMLNGTNVTSSISGYSGSGYVTGFDSDGDSVTVTINVSTASSYALTIRYASSYGDKIQDLNVNGEWIRNVTFPQSSTFATVDAGSIALNKGSNTITLSKYWGWSDVDYFEVTGTGTSSSGSTSTSSGSEEETTSVNVSDSSVYTLVTNPFDFTGSGEYFWKTTKINNFINSWSLDVLTINDIDVKNRWVSASELPSKASDGFYYIHYKSSLNWGHFGFDK